MVCKLLLVKSGTLRVVMSFRHCILGPQLPNKWERRRFPDGFVEQRQFQIRSGVDMHFDVLRRHVPCNRSRLIAREDEFERSAHRRRRRRGDRRLNDPRAHQRLRAADNERLSVRMFQSSRAGDRRRQVTAAGRRTP